MTGSGEIIHHRSKRVTSLPDAPLLRIGERFPKAAHLAPEQGEAQKPPCEVRSRWSTRRLVPHHPQPPLRLPPSSTTRADAPRPPRLPPRALPDFHSVPSSPLRFSRISQGRQYLLAPIPAGAPSLLHRDNRTLCPALATTTRPYGPPTVSPRGEQRLKSPALPGIKHQMLMAGLPASDQTSRLSSDSDSPPSARRRLLPPPGASSQTSCPKSSGWFETRPFSASVSLQNS